MQLFCVSLSYLAASWFALHGVKFSYLFQPFDNGMVKFQMDLVRQVWYQEWNQEGHRLYPIIHPKIHLELVIYVHFLQDHRIKRPIEESGKWWSRHQVIFRVDLNYWFRPFDRYYRSWGCRVVRAIHWDHLDCRSRIFPREMVNCLKLRKYKLIIWLLCLLLFRIYQ